MIADGHCTDAGYWFMVLTLVLGSKVWNCDYSVTDVTGSFKLIPDLFSGDAESQGMQSGVRRVHSKLSTLDFRRAAFGLLRVCLVEHHGIKSWREQGPQRI